MSEGYDNFSSGNFDPDDVAKQTATATLFCLVIDTSGSIGSYVDKMNEANEELFMNELKNCHKKDEIMIKAITFDEHVRHVSGFRPIVSLDSDYLKIDSRKLGGSTALYSGVKEGLSALIAYREDLEAQGIDVRSNLFIITDGADNKSGVNVAQEVTKMVEGLRINESWINTFTITMLGVGHPVTFEGSCKAMGLDPTKCLVTIGNSASEMRKVMGVVSQSVSSSSSAQTVTF